MPELNFNLSAKKGASFRKQLRLSDAAKKPIDLSTFSAELIVGSRSGNARALVMTSQAGQITLSSNGHMTLLLTVAEVRALNFIDAAFQLRLIYSATEALRLAKGRFLVEAEL